MSRARPVGELAKVSERSFANCNALQKHDMKRVGEIATSVTYDGGLGSQSNGRIVGVTNRPRTPSHHPGSAVRAKNLEHGDTQCRSARYTVDAYGKQTPMTANGTVSYATSAYGQYVGFTGRYHDWETGLVYFRERFFDVGSGRFISRDKLEYIDGSSLYQGYYVPNSIDPFGLTYGVDIDRKNCVMTVDLPIRVRLPSYMSDALKKQYEGRKYEIMNQMNMAITTAFNNTDFVSGKCKVVIKPTIAWGDDGHDAEDAKYWNDPKNKSWNIVTLHHNLPYDPQNPFADWRSSTLNGRYVKLIQGPDVNYNNHTVAHEAGHLLGLGDQYTNYYENGVITGSIPNEGYQADEEISRPANIMAGGGSAYQSDIDSIIRWSKKKCPCPCPESEGK